MRSNRIGIACLLITTVTFLSIIKPRSYRDSYHLQQPPQKERHYHKCSSQAIPYISQPLETAQYLLNTNSSFIRFGDSELLLMRGGSEPFQRYNDSLANSLKQAFTDQDRSICIGLYDTFSDCPLWEHGVTDWWKETQQEYRDYVLRYGNLSRQYFSAMLTSVYVHTYNTSCSLLPEIYSTLRNIWKNRDIILLRGNNSQVFQYDVYDTARSQKIYLAPRYHAWKSYNNLKEKLLKESKHHLFILTAGPVSRVLSYDLAKSGRRALDLGHLAKDYDLYMKGERPDGDSFYERNETPYPDC